MGEDVNHGDHITLVVVSQIYNIQFRFSPPYAPGHTANLQSWDGNLRNPELPLFLLGHFAEGGGQHYVCIKFCLSAGARQTDGRKCRTFATV